MEPEQRLMKCNIARLKAEMTSSACSNARLPGLVAEVFDRIYFQALRMPR